MAAEAHAKEQRSIYFCVMSKIKEEQRKARDENHSAGERGGGKIRGKKEAKQNKRKRRELWREKDLFLG